MNILRSLMICVYLAIHFVSCTVAGAIAADWTEFRGPGQQGHAPHEAKLPLRWSATQNVRWKTELPGHGWSSPVVSNGVIYVSAAVPQDSAPTSNAASREQGVSGTAGNSDGDTSTRDAPTAAATTPTDSASVGGKGYALQLIMIDADTGHVQRAVEAFAVSDQDSPQIHAKNSHASPTALIEGEFVYVHFGHQGIACFRRNGERVWRNNSFNYPPVHGNGGSPTIVGDKLIFSCDGETDPFILALDKATGEIAWRYDRPSDAEKKFSFSTPLLIHAAGRDQLISPGSNLVVSLDPNTGQEIWRVRYDGFSVVARPVFGHGLVYISTSFMTPATYAIRPDGQGDVTDTHVVWTEKRGAPNTPSMLLVDQWLFMVSDRGVASCLDALTGEIKWQERLGGGYSSSPLYSEGRVYFQSEEGEAIVVAAAPEFRELARNTLSERTLASYGVIDNDLLIRTDGHLYRIESAP